jgi:hypothetical protein
MIQDRRGAATRSAGKPMLPRKNTIIS